MQIYNYLRNIHFQRDWKITPVLLTINILRIKLKFK